VNKGYAKAAGAMLALLGFAVLARLLTLGAYPLYDNTEARYAEIARKMAQTGQWIMPQYDYGVPFWGKPPLSIWATAGTFDLLGVNEFAARLSSLLFCLGAVWLTYYLARKVKGNGHGLAAALVLTTTALFFVSSGSVMTDPALMLGTTLSMVAFWRADESRLWGYLFFVGMAVGLLAKGPVAVVLTMTPVCLWVLIMRNPRDTWRRLPWVTGTLLMLALALPWYLAAEHVSPGFLKYFIIGEHWDRFTVSGWHGDLYGTAHSMPRGIIWLFWLLAALPWSLYLFRPSTYRKENVRGLLRDGLRSYLLAWTVTPMLFFTMAGNVLWTYVLPGLPAFAILMSGPVVSGAEAAAASRRRLVAAACLIVPVVFVGIVLIMNPYKFNKTQKAVVDGFLAARTDPASRLVYLFNRPYSAQFYSGGEALEAKTRQSAESYMEDGEPDFFVAKGGRVGRLPENLRSRLVHVEDFGEFSLFREAARSASALPQPASVIN